MNWIISYCCKIEPFGAWRDSGIFFSEAIIWSKRIEISEFYPNPRPEQGVNFPLGRFSHRSRSRWNRSNRNSGFKRWINGSAQKALKVCSDSVNGVGSNLCQFFICWKISCYQYFINFFTPFSHTSPLNLCFLSQMALLGFYHNPSLFTSPMTNIHAGARDDRHCDRESSWGRVLERIGALKIFGRYWVWTPAACVAGECIIHCAMPLGQEFINNVVLVKMDI